MSERISKVRNKNARKIRTRSRINGTPDKPRLSVVISNAHVSAQIIDDTTHTTLASASTIGSKVSGTMTEKATHVGAKIAEAAKAKKITQVAFDKGERKYHGRIKACADAAREGGLEF